MIRPLRIGEIGGAAGEGVGSHRGPDGILQVRGGFHDDEQALIQSAQQSRKELAALFEADAKMVPEQNI